MKVVRYAKWRRTESGDLSLSGTTVACAVNQSKNSHMFVVNAGDTMVVLGCTNPCFHHGQPNINEPKVITRVMTKEHKPDFYMDKKRIELSDG